MCVCVWVFTIKKNVLILPSSLLSYLSWRLILPFMKTQFFIIITPGEWRLVYSTLIILVWHMSINTVSTRVITAILPQTHHKRYYLPTVRPRKLTINSSNYPKYEWPGWIATLPIKDVDIFSQNSNWPRFMIFSISEITKAY